jgi:hypothetical protein
MYVLLGWILVNWRIRVRRLAHEERMRALELRQPLPPEPLSGARNPYLPPLLLMGFGLGFLGISSGVDEGAMGFLGIGLVVLLLGLSWALANRLNRDNLNRREELSRKQQEAYLDALRAMATTGPATPAPPRPPMAG